MTKAEETACRRCSGNGAAWLRWRPLPRPTALQQAASSGSGQGMSGERQGRPEEAHDKINDTGRIYGAPLRPNPTSLPRVSDSIS